MLLMAKKQPEGGASGGLPRRTSRRHVCPQGAGWETDKCERVFIPLSFLKSFKTEAN